MSDPFIGEIKAVGFNFAPRQWATCEGQHIAISQNNALFALLNTTFGGNGQTDFCLPDLRGRVAVGQGQGRGLTPRLWGQMGGQEDIRLTTDHLPTHTHAATATAQTTGANDASSAAVKATTENATSATPAAGSYLATTVAGGTGPDRAELIYRDNSSIDSSKLVNLGGVSGGGGSMDDITVDVSVENTGNGSPVYNMQPFLSLYYIIALNGTFPTRS